jgi:RimJ/RimL family protein N-acetyltransferase
VSEAQVVGTCAFKGPPVSGRLEIAYFTFPGFEGRGIASRMAQELVALARATDPNVVIMAQTLRARSASTRILEKLGFELKGQAFHHIDGEVWERDLGSLALGDPGMHPTIGRQH